MMATIPKKGRRWLWRLFATLAVLWVTAQIMPPLGSVAGPNPFLAKTPGRPMVVAHAGGLGLHPGNTREAFAAAVALGCDMLEMDVRLTRDGFLVTHHNATIEKTSNGEGAVAEHTLAELQALNFGFHFRDASGAQPYRDKPAHLATLQEVFERYGRMPLSIELKDRGELGRRATVVLAQLLEQYRLTNQVLIASFDDATLNEFRRITAGRYATSMARRQTTSFVVLQKLRLDRLWPGRVELAQVPADPREAAGFALGRSSFIAAAHARNMAVHYWTVNDPEEMKRLIALGADGLITDFPDRLLAILGKP